MRWFGHRHRANSSAFVQIGAHLGGLDENDPIHHYMKSFGWHGVLVEPVPPIFRALVERSDPSQRTFDNSAVAETCTSPTITIYVISDTIDPATGFDSRSGQQLPEWITQISSLDRNFVFKHEKPFRKHGLQMSDYVVPTEVRCSTLSELLERHTLLDHSDRLKLLLIDTEGFDYLILKSLAASKMVIKTMPPFVVYEHINLQSEHRRAAAPLMEGLGYGIATAGQNKLAIQTDVLLQCRSALGVHR